MNLNNELKRENIESYLENHKRIFFMRICGTGMGASAVLLKEAGFIVEGADTSFAPPMSDFLDSMDIPCHQIDLVDSKFLQNYDLIVVGNSVSGKSDMARMIEECGTPFTSFPTLLGESVLKHKEVMAVIGTHGKTTTSFFLTQMLENMGLKPGYFIGGVIEGRSSSTIGKDKYFIIEGDEYDSAYFQKYSKFHEYFIDDLICTSIEFDHADIFEDLAAVKAEFSDLFKKMKGHIVYDPSFHVTKEILDSIQYENQESYSPQILNESEEGTTFLLNLFGEKEEFRTNIVGLHNIANISGCLVLLKKKGFSLEELKKSILKLAMVKRRQEKRGFYKQAIFIDDFAHHPRAIIETTKAIKLKYPNKKIWVIFEPVSATARSNVFQNEFTRSFQAADGVIIADTGIQTTAKKFDQLDTNKLVKDINEMGVRSLRVSELSELLNIFEEEADANSLFLVLSNRTCLGLWSSDFVKKLK